MSSSRGATGLRTSDGVGSSEGRNTSKDSRAGSNSSSFASGGGAVAGDNSTGKEKLPPMAPEPITVRRPIRPWASGSAKRPGSVARILNFVITISTVSFFGTVLPLALLLPSTSTSIIFGNPRRLALEAQCDRVGLRVSEKLMSSTSTDFFP
ncbi:protein PHYTOCHROME KINASE SUBSTRATE 4 [Iris pallida]|uniref:Protein PHYTOCHROME KINASE SUBSTRATE 4 n=1 Tax=Iris pallida TaxID=29817 RepID=A0AAX6E459_IRIPA|nr:protein PHYTOCHROME KINASE SUBSTRATE 4 [Iris pallida]